MQNIRHSTRRQHGSALLAILIMLGIFATLLVGTLNRATSQNARNQSSADALVKAKDALIGYAATYQDSHPTEVFGYLPLPDLGSSRNANGTDEGNAAGSFAGNAKNLTVIGRLPWRALGLPALRDGQGECLWYAVSGSFQNMSKADVLNWDSLGHFDTYSSKGTSSSTVSTTGTNYHQRPVAIIFSAGAALTGQNRQTSTTDAVATCGGNYDARNYLDSYNADANINSIVNYYTSANNATGYAYSLTSVSDGSLLTALTAPKKIIIGDASTSTGLGKIANDRILVITADDIFKLVKQRSDFKADIDTMMTELAGCLSAMPTGTLPAASGSKGIDGPLGNATVANCLGLISTTKKANIRNNWKENLLYAKLPTPTPITGATNTGACEAALIFGGERTATQARAVSSDKSNPAMYLEDVNATSFPNGTAYSGIPAYDSTNPSSDVVICISTCLSISETSVDVQVGATKTLTVTNPACGTLTSTSNNSSVATVTFPSGVPTINGIGAGTTTVTIRDGAKTLPQITVNVAAAGGSTPPQVSFASNIGSFKKAGSSGAVVVGAGTVSLTNGSQVKGCFWYPTAKALSGKTMRAYFEFQLNYTEKANKNKKGYGLNFALLPSDTPSPDTKCGKNSRGGYGSSSSWPSTSFGIQMDTYYSSGENDPGPSSPPKNHVAFLPSNSINHASTSSVTSSCNATSPSTSITGCYHASSSGTPNWFEDSAKHKMRIEMQTLCNSSCSACGSSGSKALVKIWADCSDATCNDFSANYSATTPQVAYCTALPSTLNNVFFGFTSGNTGSENVTVSNFGIGFY